MSPARTFALALLALLAGPPLPVTAAVRVEPEGAAPFVLPEALVEDSTRWYDAQAWLARFPGSTEWDPDRRQLTYREGSHWAALRPEPPFAVRDGRSVRDAPPVILRDGRLLVSERFLATAATEVLGRRLQVKAEREGAPRRIALDPGHGGSDVGTLGGNGVTEKDAVLALALAVAEHLRRSGFEVHLTRTEDRDLGEASRSAVANYWGAELFLSLHAAGRGRPQARGFELFVAPRTGPGIDGRLWEAGQAGLDERSRQWAAELRAALGEEVATFDRGISVLPNPVLEAVTAPACLLEVGSLAWPQEADFLRGEAGKDAVGRAVARAAERYFTR